MELENFGEALEALVVSEAENYGDGASIEELHRLLSRFEAFVTEATAAFEAGEEWAADGAKTASAWLATRCRVPRGAARRRVRLGRALRHLPECAEAWREGAIGLEQAQAIASARRHRTESAMARDESMLVAQASEMGFEDFYRALSYWKQLADPDGADAAEEDRKAARNVFVEASFSGMWLGQMTLDPVSGAIVSGELNRLEHDLFEADCAEAKERLGRPARLDELARTAAQRRADALVEMATRSATAPADGIRPAPLFSVFVGYETLHGRISELENGTVLAPSALTPWMDSAYFERAIFSSATGSTSACGPGSSAAGPAGPSSCATASAPTPTATSPPRAARATTSRPGPPVERPPKRTGACSAGSTTACATSANARSSASGPRRARPEGRRPPSGPARPGLPPADCQSEHSKPEVMSALRRAGAHMRDCELSAPWARAQSTSDAYVKARVPSGARTPVRPMPSSAQSRASASGCLTLPQTRLPEAVRQARMPRSGAPSRSKVTV